MYPIRRKLTHPASSAWPSMLLAGATIPMVSPGSNAGGRIKARGGIGSVILNEKLASADNGRRTRQRDLAIPLHGLRPARRVHANRRVALPQVNRSHRRGTRAGARRLRFSSATFIDTDVNMMAIHNPHKFYVRSLGKV